MSSQYTGVAGCITSGHNSHMGCAAMIFNISALVSFSPLHSASLDCCYIFEKIIEFLSAILVIFLKRYILELCDLNLILEEVSISAQSRLYEILGIFKTVIYQFLGKL